MGDTVYQYHKPRELHPNPPREKSWRRLEHDKLKSHGIQLGRVGLDLHELNEMRHFFSTPVG